MQNYLNPTNAIRAKDDDHERADKPERGIESVMQKKFLEERKLFFWGETSEEACRKACEKLLYLEADKPGEEISVYLNSPGGSVTAGIALYDTMVMISSPIRIVVMGMAASMGSILLCAGDKGKRQIFPHGRVLIHQPLITGRFMGPAVDIHIQAQEMEKIRDEMNRILADASGQSIEKIREDSDRDFYLSAQEAIDYGLADEIVRKLD